MTRSVLGVVALIAGSGLVGALPQAQPTPQQLQAQVQQLASDLAAEREKTDALARSAAEKTQQLTALQRQMPSACVATIEKANPTKLVDPTTFVLRDKPAAKQ